MEEIKKLTCAIIEELEIMTREEIEQFRAEWREAIRRDEKLKAVNEKVMEALINYACDYAVKRIS